MEIKAEGIITKEDFGVAQKHIIKSTKKEMKKKYPKLLGLFPMIVIVIIIGLALHYIGKSIEYDSKTVVNTILITAVIFLFVSKLYIKFIKKLPSSKGIYLGKHSYTIKEDGLLEESENQASTLKWSGVLNIEETSDMIFIYVDSIAAHFIPKHFFSNENEFNNFKAALFDKCKHLQKVA